MRKLTQGVKMKMRTKISANLTGVHGETGEGSGKIKTTKALSAERRARDDAHLTEEVFQYLMT